MRVLVRGLQAFLVMGAVAIAARIYARNHPPPPTGVEFALSILGERSDPDGTVTGVDLLKHPDRAFDGFEVAVTPTTSARVVIDEIGSAGTRRLYPDPSQSGLLTGGRTYALPGAHAFYERIGKVRLRVTVLPEAGGQDATAEAFGPEGAESLTLANGQPFVASSRLYHAPQGGRVELELP
jgi:hypothetical protein